MNTDITYRGLQRAAGGSVIVAESADGEQIGLVRHVIKHSPTGIGWGYAGSGAADCSRSLLLAAIGNQNARCVACHGGGKLVYDIDADSETSFDPDDAPDPELIFQCDVCDGDGLRALPYQAFKFAFVAGWQDGWTMTRREIIAWLVDQGIELHHPLETT